jgi:hypothetical protein
MSCGVVWQKLTDVSEKTALMIEAVSTPGTSVIYTRLHGTTFQKTVIFILVAVRT